MSWNVGVGDLFASYVELYLHPFSRKIPKFINPQSETKDLDLQYRGSSFSPICGYQRQYCKEKVANNRTITHSDPYTRIPHDEYEREGKRAKAILSPFGWGEVCGRDFEAFVYGAIMIKMSMSHCYTFPDAYQENLTYVPVKWDFSDLDEVMEGIPQGKYSDIAKSAQIWYRGCFGKEFNKKFANHFLSELNR